MSDTICPTCGDSFSHERYMKSHHKQAHDKSIQGVKVECDSCGNVFRKKRNEVEKYDSHYCSNDCQSAAMTENVRECSFCHSEFHYQQKNQKYCSIKCYNKDRKNGKTVECFICGTKVYKSKAQLEDSNTGKYFCTIDCRSSYYSGENNPAWKDKSYSDFTKTPEGRKWRSSVLERDGYECQKCGSTENLHAHHIKSKSEFPELKLSLENGVTLCSKCHSEEHEDESYSKVILYA